MSDAQDRARTLGVAPGDEPARPSPRRPGVPPQRHSAAPENPDLDALTLDADRTAAIPARPDDPVLLGGRYRLEERVASGGMASVWRGYDELLARTVGVKILHEHLAADDAFRERFRREAIAAAKLSHPNIVGLYDTGSAQGRTYLVMEFVQGVTLKDVIGDLGVLDPGQAATVGEKVARALHYAHERGLVHRDVKPANILIGDDGSVKVADFGIAKAADEDHGDLTHTGMVLGTAAYVAPEQILAQPVDGRADQYALGCMLYEAVTGRRPFAAESAVATAALRLKADPPPLRSLRPDVPRGLEAAIMRALARDPAERFPNAGMLADALLRFADADTGQTAALATNVETTIGLPAAGQDAAQGRRQRSRGGVLTAFVALLLLAGAVSAALAGGWFDIGPMQLRGGSEPQTARPAPPALVVPARITSFDPPRGGGDGHENEERLDALFDGRAETLWRTELYNTRAFGGLKSGVGFFVDLGTTHRLEQVALRTTTPGIRYEVRVPGQRGAVASAPTTIEAWEPVGVVARAQGLDSVEFDQGPVTRYLLVWITGNLQPVGSRYAAAFAEMAVRGAPSPS